MNSRLWLLASTFLLLSTANYSAVGQNKTKHHAEKRQSLRVNGLYVNGLTLYGGVSLEKVKAKLGTDDERYGEPDKTTYLWRLKGGSVVTAEFDRIGSLRSASINASASKAPNTKIFAVLNGTRIVPGQVTLEAVRKLFPGGQMGEIVSGENLNFVDYIVRFGGEGAEAMRFSVSWLGNPQDKNRAQQSRMKVEVIKIGYAIEQAE